MPSIEFVLNKIIMISVDMPNNISPFTVFIIGIIFMDAYQRKHTYISFNYVCIQETNQN
jgi:hypothetical protein